MTGAGTFDDEDHTINIPRIFVSLTKLARSDDPLATQYIHDILSSFNFDPNPANVARKRQSEDATVTDKNSSTSKKQNRNDTDEEHKETSQDKWQCTDCTQNFCNQSYFYRHINNEHSVKRKPLVQSNMFKCAVCDKKYGTEASLRDHENIHASTSNAPNPKKKKKENIKLPCDYCDGTFSNKSNLRRHIDNIHLGNRSENSVTPRAARGVQNMSGATRDAQSAEPLGGDTKTEIKCKPGAKYKNQKQMRIQKKYVSGMIVYQCEKCEVATNTYDASVEHAQLHCLEGYTPMPETCHICKLSFEPQCYAEHVSSHDHDTERKILKYNPLDLLNDEWFNIFQDFPEKFANQIISSSVYKHTRAVKINSDEVAGIPLYQCGMCELYVHPEEVEQHCRNKNACVGNKSHDYYCPECDIYFYTLVAITEHRNDHKNGLGISSFRKATFNCKQDATINRVLGELPNSDVEIPSGTQRENKPLLEIHENRVVGVFCESCNKTIMYSEFETHAATHETHGNRENEDDDLIMDEGELDVISHNKTVMTVNSNEGIVEKLHSNNDCHGLESSTYDLEVEVDIQREDGEEFRSNNTCGASNERIMQAENNDIFNQEMVNDLESDLQNVFKENKSDICTPSSVVDENMSTQELLNIRDNESDTSRLGNPTNNIETGESNQGHKNEVERKNDDAESETVAISQDIFASDSSEVPEGSDTDTNMSMGETIESPTHNTTVNSDTTENSSNENKNGDLNSFTDTVNLDTNDEEDDAIKRNCRLSSRDILNRIVTHGDLDEVDAVSDVRNREKERQRFVDEARRIRDIMCSRD